MDPWLTQTKKTCPVCKQRVTRPNPEYSESSDSDGESGLHEAGEEDEGAISEADSERTPLLRPSNPASPASSSPPPTYASTVTSEAAVATVTTSAQCLPHAPQPDVPLLGYDEYYSPIEDSGEGTDEEEGHPSDSDTTELIGRGAVRVWEVD